MFTLTINLASKGRGGVVLKDGLRSKPAVAAIHRRFMEAGVDLRAALIKEAPRDTGGVANAHAYAMDDAALRLVLFNRKAYALYAHEGRKPGKRPPIEALIPWCRRHVVNKRIATNLLTTGLRLRKSATKGERDEARRYAFALARWIGLHGVKPNRWFDRVLENSGLKRIEKAGNLIGEDLGKLVGASVEQAVASQNRGAGIVGFAI